MPADANQMLPTLDAGFDFRMEEFVEIGVTRNGARYQQERGRQHSMQPTSNSPVKKQIQTSQLLAWIQNTPLLKVARRHEVSDIAIPRSRMRALGSMVPAVRVADAHGELLTGTRDKSVLARKSLLYDQQE
jgi:hypothetical protein